MFQRFRDDYLLSSGSSSMNPESHWGHV
uniref:Uncharacterized protein n=1 Tax=Anguilla anguilla TaxID=7936 RepID=A0A0E9QBK8_ANGAN